MLERCKPPARHPSLGASGHELATPHPLESVAEPKPAGAASAPTLAEGGEPMTFGGAVGRCAEMQTLFQRLERAAGTVETILLVGERGTGKELLARAVHQKSARREGPFVVLDCAGVTAGLVEAEIFGRAEPGSDAAGSVAGLLEQADKGTLFLDDVDELPLEVQSKLVRALESGRARRLGAEQWRTVDVRVLAATHRDLRALGAHKGFREDLYYRLSVVEVRVPPLRSRREDIPILVEHFRSTMDSAAGELSTEALESFGGYGWPGNVRELQNTVRRLALFPELGRDAIAPAAAALSASDLPMEVARLRFREARDLVVGRFERAYLSMQLSAHHGHVARAARAMGVSRQFAYKLFDRHGIKSARAEALEHAPPPRAPTST